MLRKTSVKTLAATASSTREFVATFQDHLAHTLEDAVAHASELAHHCGRKRVQHHDVAQAMSNLCLMCASYHVGPNGHPVCKVLSTAKTVGGGIGYEGYCDGDRSQCSTGFGTCVSLAGGGKKRRGTKRQRRRPQAGHTRRRRRTLRGTRQNNARGGNIIPNYLGYCDGDTSQCTFSEELAAQSAACDASGGRKRRRPVGPRGGNIIPSYLGYCDTHPSQCTFSEELAAQSAECAASGGRRSRRRTTRRGGQPTGPSLVVQKAVREYGKANYEVAWTPDSLRLLERGLQFHARKVLRDTQEDMHFKRSDTMALTRVLETVG
jgi:histone H3/H4